MEAFAPVLVYIIFVAGFVVTNLVLTHLIGPNRKSTVKDMPYESGMDPVGDARQPFDVKFYLVAILFLVFDGNCCFFTPGRSALTSIRGGSTRPCAVQCSG